MIAWQNDPDGYAVTTLTTTGAVLALAESATSGSVQWFSRWIAEGGHADSAVLALDGHTVRILQGANAGQGLLIVWAIENGIASNELVLMLLGEGYGSASTGINSNNDGYGPVPATTLPGAVPLILLPTGIITIPIPMQTRAALRLMAKATLTAIKTLKARATLKLQAKPLAANAIPAPSGLGAAMKIISDPWQKDRILDQYLRLWFYGHPRQCAVAVNIDHGTEFQPAWTWENPGTTQPAILKIDGADIPGDGLIHQITVRVWQAVSGKTSLSSTITLFEKTPKPALADQPDWCGATLIRQGTPELADLTRIDWRHDGAVAMVARYPKWNNATAKAVTTQSIIGYADYDEDHFIMENMGLLLDIFNFQTVRDVTFGVCAIGHNELGPPLFAPPVSIKVRRLPEAITPTSPDQATAQNWKTQIVPRSSYSIPTTFNAWLRSEVTQSLGRSLSTLDNNVVDQALYRLFLKIKDAIRQGGTVTLDNLGRFEARWNTTRTTRSVAFVASPGYQEGTRAGRIMTDEEAKA